MKKKVGKGGRPKRRRSNSTQKRLHKTRFRSQKKACPTQVKPSFSGIECYTRQESSPEEKGERGIGGREDGDRGKSVAGGKGTPEWTDGRGGGCLPNLDAGALTRHQRLKRKGGKQQREKRGGLPEPPCELLHYKKKWRKGETHLRK